MTKDTQSSDRTMRMLNRTIQARTPQDELHSAPDLKIAKTHYRLAEIHGRRGEME